MFIATYTKWSQDQASKISKWISKFWGWGVWRGKVGVGVKSCKDRVPLGALPIHLFRQFCCRMYRFATIHSVTDRQTDRRHYGGNSRLYCVAVWLAKMDYWQRINNL